MEQKKFYAGGFLYNPKTNRVLLHKRDGNTNINPNKWAFFGGLNEGEESPVETFVREIHEELGVNISITDVRPLCDYLNEELGTYRHVFFVESEIKKSEMTLREGADFEWIPFGRVFDYDLTEKTEKDLLAFSRFKRV